ncbi:MAG: hypothetical protein IH606_15945 [Burkholderiales bacterium]|nr:hypothetical protein [Burkholderiales bacterium]
MVLLCAATQNTARHPCVIVISLRGRKTVRADRRLRTDDEPIRARSAILDNSNPKPGFINNRIFHTDVLLIRMENTFGARSAQALS